jgi:hypothetical protein
VIFSEIGISPPSRTARRDLPLQQKEAKPKQRNRGKRKEVRGVGGRMVGVFSEIANYPPSITARRDLPPQQKEAKPKQRNRGKRKQSSQEGGEKNAGKWKQGVNTPAKCYVSRQRRCVQHCREAPPRRASTITQQLPYSVGEEGAPGTIAPTITPNNYPKRRGKRPGDCWELNSKQLQRKSV